MKTPIKEHIAVFGCFIFFVCLRRYVIFPIFRTLIEQQSSISDVAAIFLMIGFPVVLLFLYIRWAGLDTFRLADIEFKTWLCVFLLSVSQYIILCIPCGYPVLINPENITYGMEITYHTDKHFILSSFFRIFCTPVVSVILFRGLLQKQLSKIVPAWLSISLITLLLVLLNNNMIDRVPAFISGIYAGIIFHKTGKLILCIFYSSFFQLLWSVLRFSFNREFWFVFVTLAVIFSILCSVINCVIK